MSYYKRRTLSSVTLHEFFPRGFLTESLMTTTYMVSYHGANDQEDLIEKEEKVSLEETKITKERKVKSMPWKKRLLYVLAIATR